jgi:hypothetical protein
MYSKKPENNDFTQLIQIIKAKNGNKTEVCKAYFGISRQTLNTWEKEHPEIKEAFEEAEEELLDFVEGQAKIMMQGIAIWEIDKTTGKKYIVDWKVPPNTRLMMYTLSHKGRKRGYIPIQHLDVTTNGKGLNEIPQIYILPDGTEVKF